jgi:hypothetical protein
MDIDLEALRKKVATARKSGSMTALNVYEEHALIEALTSLPGSNPDRDGMVKAIHARDKALRDLAITIAALRDVINTPSGDLAARARLALREIGVEAKK